MDYQKILLKNYHKHTQFLDPSDQQKLAWFNDYFEKVYKPYFASIPHQASILELGCNKGYLLHTLYHTGYHNLQGVDLAEQDLEIAKRIVPQAQFYGEDIFTFLQNHKSSFDLIILKALIEHISKEKILPLLQLIHESLNIHGMVLIDVQNSDWLFGLHDRYVDFTHEVGFTKESLRQVMHLYFNDVEVHPTQSPCKLGIKGTIKHYIAKKIFFGLTKWADPESPTLSIKERLLIATGKK